MKAAFFYSYRSRRNSRICTDAACRVSQQKAAPIIKDSDNGAETRQAASVQAGGIKKDRGNFCLSLKNHKSYLRWFLLNFYLTNNGYLCTPL
jgi:hypothetical protein